ncbi:MAG TPA: ATPase [Candidatus Angelobacter sp.]
MVRKSVLAILVFALAQMAGLAEVADSGANGFTIKIVTSIHAVPADVYKKLVHNVGDWWNSQHTFSGDAHNLSIEERPMGCFCEKLANGGGVRHMEVLYFQPGQMLRMSGALGPFQGMGAAGTLTFALTLDAGGTKLEVTYALAGYQPQGMSSWAVPSNGMLTEQVTRLKNYVETGNPTGPAQQPKLPA